MEDYTQQNRCDHTQQNRDWAALENPQIDTLNPNFEKTTLTTYKIKYISKLVRPRLNRFSGTLRVSYHDHYDPGSWIIEEDYTATPEIGAPL